MQKAEKNAKIAHTFEWDNLTYKDTNIHTSTL